MIIALIIGIGFLLMALSMFISIGTLYSLMKDLIINECERIRDKIPYLSKAASNREARNECHFTHALKELHKDMSNMSQENFYRSGSRYEEHEEVMKKVEKMKENTEIRLNDIVGNIASLRKSLDRNAK